MISLKEQRKRDQFRKQNKKALRMMKQENKPVVSKQLITAGNKDHGIPFRGKDRYSGQLKKFGDRVYEEDVLDSEGKVIGTRKRLLVYDNNKYNPNGSLVD